MKLTVFILIVFTVFLNLSCQRAVSSSPISPNEKIAEIPKPTPTPEKFEKIYIIDAMNDDESSLLEFQDYKLEKVTVKKKEYDEPEVDIFDAVLSKNGKKIARFEGSFNPLGNWMSFGLYSFLGESDKQLWISDKTGSKDGNDWIVSLTPKDDQNRFKQRLDL